MIVIGLHFILSYAFTFRGFAPCPHNLQAFIIKVLKGRPVTAKGVAKHNPLI